MGTLLYDPPSGWKYGFPKPYPHEDPFERRIDLRSQLIKDGYPQSEIDSLGDNLYVRFIGGENESTSLWW